MLFRSRRNFRTRFNVFADGEYILTLDKRTLDDFGIRDGDEIDDATDLIELTEAAECVAALERSYTFLESRMRSGRELRQNLQRAGYFDLTIDVVLEKLEDQGFLDDRAFSDAWAQSKLSSKSMRAVVMDLRQKGVSSEIIDEIKELEQPEDETEKCAAVIRRYLRGRDDPKTELRKATQACARKGYNWDTIRNALARLEVEVEEYL